MIFPGTSTQAGARIFSGQSTLTEDDARRSSAECPSVAYVSPSGAHRRQVVAGELNWAHADLGRRTSTGRSSARGTSRRATSSREADVRVGGEGRGARARRSRTSSPTRTRSAQSVRIKNVPFQVVGVLEKKGGSTMGKDQDDPIVVPYTTVMKRLERHDRDRHVHGRRRSRRPGPRGADARSRRCCASATASARARTPTS